MSRTHMLRERDEPGSYPEVVVMLKREFREETETIKKAFPQLYAEYPVPDHSIQEPDTAQYITANPPKQDGKKIELPVSEELAALKKDITALQFDFADLRQNVQQILKQQKAVIALMAKMNANGNAVQEKNIRQTLTQPKSYLPASGKKKSKAKKNDH